MKEELKAALQIAYPNLEGLPEWEPTRRIVEDAYDFKDLNTNQIDVTGKSYFSILTRKTQLCGLLERN
jgi:hypothetical protein